MKKHYLNCIPAVALISLSLAGCTKKDAPLEEKLTTQTLTGRYKLTELTGETAITPPISAMGKLDACELDNIYELNADSTANYIDAGTKCSPEKSYSFKYNMTSNTVFLIRIQSPYLQGGSVKKFDGKTLILEAKIKSQETNNIPTTVLATLVKQEN